MWIVVILMTIHATYVEMVVTWFVVMVAHQLSIKAACRFKYDYCTSIFFSYLFLSFIIFVCLNACILRARKSIFQSPKMAWRVEIFLSLFLVFFSHLPFSYLSALFLFIFFWVGWGGNLTCEFDNMINNYMSVIDFKVPFFFCLFG